MHVMQRFNGIIFLIKVKGFESFEYSFFFLKKNQFYFQHMPVSKKHNHMLELKKCTKHVTETITNVSKFVLSVILSGTTFAKASLLLTLNDVSAPSSSSFFRIQHKVTDVLVSMARTSCNYWKNLMQKGSTILFDGSWSQKREAPFCFVQIIDNTLRKIVDYEVVAKSFGKFKGNYNGPSNQMEGAALQTLFSRWKSNELIKSYVHDGDLKVNKIISNIGMKISELQDPGHKIKNVMKKFDLLKLEKASALRPRLIRFAHMLIKAPITIIEKQKYWVNAVKHFCGDHSGCMSKTCHGYRWIVKDNNMIKKLSDFLEETKDMFVKVAPGLNTQACESINHIKERKAEKSVSWKISFFARMAAVVVQFNQGLFFLVVEARRRLNLPFMPESIFRKFRMYCNKKDANNIARRSPEYRQKANRQRALAKHRNAPDDIKSILRHK